MRNELVISCLLALVVGCGGGQDEAPAPSEPPATAKAPAEGACAPAPSGASILMVQAAFETKNGRPSPAPAKLTLWTPDGDEWSEALIEDPDSAVFHKAVVWRDGILTIAQGMPNTQPAAPAKLSHWTYADCGWKENVLWSQTWGGKFQRLRDMEFGDFDGDGADEIAIATHDMGVVAVVDEAADGTWQATEMDEKADTFVHEVEVGDVDADGVVEFYVTPSDRNKSSGVSQPGGVARYDLKDGKYVSSEVVMFDDSHAKEILAADVDGNGFEELYVVKEGHVVKEDGETRLKDPVKIVQMIPGDSGWTQRVVATLDGDPQCRFLLAGDVNHDGATDLVAAGKETGLWMLTRNEDGTYTNALIDKNSGGFEHATHAADLDGDGKLEIYVAADTQRAFRRYVWTGEGWDRTEIDDIPQLHITWNLQDGVL